MVSQTAVRRILVFLTVAIFGVFILVASIVPQSVAHEPKPAAPAAFWSVDELGRNLPTVAERARVARLLETETQHVHTPAVHDSYSDPLSDLLYKWLHPYLDSKGTTAGTAWMSADLPSLALGLPGTFNWAVASLDTYSSNLAAFDIVPNSGTETWSGVATTVADGSSASIPAYADLKSVQVSPLVGGSRWRLNSYGAMPGFPDNYRLAYNTFLANNGAVFYVGPSQFSASGWKWAVVDRANYFPWWNAQLDATQAGTGFPDSKSIQFAVETRSALQSSYDASAAWPRFEWYIDADNNSATGDDYSFGYRHGSENFSYLLEGIEAIAQAYYDPGVGRWVGQLRKKTGPGKWESVAVGVPVLASNQLTLTFDRADVGLHSTFRWGLLTSFDVVRGVDWYYGRVDVAPNSGMKTETTSADPDLLLAEQYAPIFYRAASDELFPVAIEFSVDNAVLRNKSGVVISEDPKVSDLVAHSDADNYLDFVGVKPCQTIRHWHASSGAGREPTVYARVFKDGDRTAIQYWLHYYYSSWGFLQGTCDEPLWGKLLSCLGAGNNHEGDWELVQVNLRNGMPESAVYAQHIGQTKRLWQHVEQENGHPVVYVGYGSHASYFRDSYYSQLSLPERTGRVAMPSLAVDLLKENGQTPWLLFAGHWGADNGAGGSGTGPAQKPDDRWSDPLDWTDSLLTLWDDEFYYRSRSTSLTMDGIASRHTTVELRAENGQVLLGKSTNKLDPDGRKAEYMLNCQNDSRQSLLVHKALVPTYAKFHFQRHFEPVVCGGGSSAATGAATEPLSFEIVIAGPAEGVVKRLTFANVSMEAGAAAQIALDVANPMLEVDQNSDGTYEQQVAPTSTETEEVDFYPPQTIKDLKFIAGAGSLQWTAPADDGPEGKAAAYNVRYADFPVTEATWDYAEPLVHTLVPGAAGAQEMLTLNQVPPGTYHFALRANDLAFNTSAVSNDVTAVIQAGSNAGAYLPLVVR